MDADTGKVGTMPVTPSIVIETQPGNAQPVILFDHSVAPEKAESLARALQKATGSDFGTGDIPHVWRIPGTLNFPSPSKIARGRNSEPAAVLLQQSFVGEVHSAKKLGELLSQTSAAIGRGLRELPLGDRRQHDAVDWQAAMEALLLVTEHGGQRCLLGSPKSVVGQSRHFGSRPATSALPP
jgi:RepB DNA-primase N-terminal domain